MKLLEVVKTDLTNPEVFSSVTTWGQEIGKTTVPCKDTPGFVVNRLLVPFLFEAVRMVERGDATIKDVDVAMKLGAGHPMGPFELFDYIGHDTMDLIMEGWSGRYPEETLFRRSETVQKLVAEGKLGKINQQRQTTGKSWRFNRLCETSDLRKIIRICNNFH